MKITRLAGALALAQLLCAPVLAADPNIGKPATLLGGYGPVQAIYCPDSNGNLAQCSFGALPTGAATSANQTNGSEVAQVLDSGVADNQGGSTSITANAVNKPGTAYSTLGLAALTFQVVANTAADFWGLQGSNNSTNGTDGQWDAVLMKPSSSTSSPAVGTTNAATGIWAPVSALPRWVRWYSATANASGTLTIAVNLKRNAAPTGVEAYVPNAVSTVGNVASGATDTGNPEKVGCVFRTTLPTVTDGQRVDSQCTARGMLRIAVSDGSGNALSLSPTNAAIAPISFNGSMLAASLGFGFDGTNWQMLSADTTGMRIGGHGTLATGQVSVGTTATLIAAARTGRQKIGVTVTSAVQCAFGNSGVTLSTGWPLAAVAYASDNWDTAAALYGVCASTATVGYREQY